MSDYSKRDKMWPTEITLSECPKCHQRSLHPSDRLCFKCDYVNTDLTEAEQRDANKASDKKDQSE